MKYATNIDLNQNEIKNAVLHCLAAEPSNPKEGQNYFNLGTKRAYVCTQVAPEVVWTPMDSLNGGTDSSSFYIGKNGVKLQTVDGGLEVRNNENTDFADLKVKNLTVEGTTTTVNSEEVNIADNKIILNSNIVSSVNNQDGGIAVKRLMVDDTTRKDAEIEYDSANNRWKSVQGEVAGILTHHVLANKVVASIGDGVATSIAVTHNLNTMDCIVGIRDVVSPFEGVLCNWEFTSVNVITFKFLEAPLSGKYSVTIIG